MYCKKKKVKDKKQNAHIMFRNQLGSTTEKYASEKNGVCTHECEREIQNSPGKRKKYLGGCQEATAKNCGNLRNCARLKKKKKTFQKQKHIFQENDETKVCRKILCKFRNNNTKPLRAIQNCCEL
jgi:hypothetical protein